MRSPATAREWYGDRNPVKIERGVDVNTGAATRALTEDWTYTVPAGKKAFLELARAHVLVDSTTVTNSNAVYAQVVYTRSGGSARTLASVAVPDGSSRYRADETYGASLLMLPGDNLKGQSRSASSSVDVNLQTSIVVTEFDA